MSKRPADIPMTTSNKKKRKHLCLSIAQKVKLLEKLDKGVSVKRLTEEYGVGMTTIYDLKKQKDKLLKFYAESDEPKLMKTRKTLHKAKNEDLDRVLKEWIRQRRSEHMPLNGMLIMKQAKIYHDELKIEGNCEYSTGWLQKFKKRHGIKFLKLCRDKASIDHKTEKLIEEVDVEEDFNINSNKSSVKMSSAPEPPAFKKEPPKEKDFQNPGLRGVRTTTLFRAVNPELFIKPNKPVMAFGLVTLSLCVAYIGYLHATQENKNNLYEAIDSEGHSYMRRKTSKWD